MRSILLTAAFVCLTLVPSAGAATLAFPGAEGFGAYASGGRGGEVYHVTTLQDYAAGCFRYAFSSMSPKTIVFDVGGTIVLNSRLDIGRSNFTIAGQTAPGGGITIAGGQVSIRNNANVIVRHVRFRLTDTAGTSSSGGQFDTFALLNCNTAIVDHVSSSWGMDECLSVTGTSNNVTVQNSLISEGLNVNDHGYGSLIAPELPDSKISFHHNLYAHQYGRVPRAGSRLNQTFTFDFVNNVIYNWGNDGDWGGWGCIGSEEKLDTNYVNNYAIAGPNTVRRNMWSPDVSLYIQSSESLATRVYQSGNKIDSDRDGTLDGADTGWAMFRGTRTQMTSAFSIPTANAITTQTADQAYASLIDGAGATPWNRDEVDTRVIGSVVNQNGSIIDSQTQVGGLPDLGVTYRPAGFDSDGDGMPNYWEASYGCDPGVWDSGTTGRMGYSYLEWYLQWLLDPTGVAAPADFNFDGRVNVGDLGMLAGSWGQTGSPAMSCDANGDGVINVGDLGVLASHWGWVSPGPAIPPTSVPEPACLTLLGLGGLALLRRRS